MRKQKTTQTKKKTLINLPYASMDCWLKIIFFFRIIFCFCFCVLFFSKQIANKQVKRINWMQFIKNNLIFSILVFIYFAKNSEFFNTTIAATDRKVVAVRHLHCLVFSHCSIVRFAAWQKDRVHISVVELSLYIKNTALYGFANKMVPSVSEGFCVLNTNQKLSITIIRFKKFIIADPIRRSSDLIWWKSPWSSM